MPSQDFDVHLLGHRRDEADDRDVAYVPPAQLLASKPPAVDLRAHCGPAYNQLRVKSCSAHALASHITFIANKEARAIDPPSRLFIYWNERMLAGTQTSDSGSTLRNGIKAVAKQGVCAESLWPYDPAHVLTPPPQTCYDNAKVHAVTYSRIDQRLDHLAACIAEGFPFVFGMTVYKSMLSAGTTGTLPMPAADDEKLGDHAVMAAGYDDDAKTFLVLNSVGETWGKEGYFSMPYAYLMSPDLTYDFWTIRAIS